MRKQQAREEAKRLHPDQFVVKVVEHKTWFTVDMSGGQVLILKSNA